MGLAAARRRALLGQPDQAARGGCPVSPALRGVGGGPSPAETRQLPRWRREARSDPQRSAKCCPGSGPGGSDPGRLPSVPRLPDTTDLGEVSCSPGRLLAGRLPSFRSCQRLPWRAGPPGLQSAGGFVFGGGEGLALCHHRSSHAHPGVPPTAAEPRRPEHGVHLVDPGGASALRAPAARRSWPLAVHTWDWETRGPGPQRPHDTGHPQRRHRHFSGSRS